MGMFLNGIAPYEKYKNFVSRIKIDATPEHAVQQIKDKGYSFRPEGKLAEKQKYPGRILSVGITYDKKTKKHSCLVEDLSRNE